MDTRENCFAISNVLPGKLNALVKTAMNQTGVDDPNEAVRLVNSGEWIITKNQNGPDLNRVNGVTIYSRGERFLAKEKFKLVEDGGIFHSLSHDFCEWFLSGEGKIEEPQKGRLLSLNQLAKDLRGEMLSHALIREGKIVLCLGDVFEIVSKQLSGEIHFMEPPYHHLFYVRDQKDYLRVVSAQVLPNKWANIEAYQLAVGWSAGTRVFSEETLLD